MVIFNLGRVRTICTYLLLCFFVLPFYANASEEENFQVAAKTFNFIPSISKGELNIAIIYDPNISESNQTAKKIGSSA